MSTPPTTQDSPVSQSGPKKTFIYSVSTRGLLACLRKHTPRLWRCVCSPNLTRRIPSRLQSNATERFFLLDYKPRPWSGGVRSSGVSRGVPLYSRSSTFPFYKTSHDKESCRSHSHRPHRTRRLDYPTDAPSSAPRRRYRHAFSTPRPRGRLEPRLSLGLGAAKHALQHGDLLLARRGLRVKVLLEVVDEREAGREGDGWLAVK